MFFRWEDEPILVPAENELSVEDHDAMVVRNKLSLSMRRIEVQHRQLALMRCSTERAFRRAFIVEGIPFLLAVRIRARLQDIHRLNQRRFPFVGGRALCWIMQPIEKGAFKQRRKIGPGNAVWNAICVFPGQFARLGIA